MDGPIKIEEFESYPIMSLAELLFKIQLNPSDAESTARLQAAIVANEMAPFYMHCCNVLGWRVDDALVSSLVAANDAKLAELDALAVEAAKSEGVSEVREALQAKTDYLAKIGDRERSEAAAVETIAKTAGPGQKLDVVFTLLRLGLFYSDHTVIRAKIEKARELVAAGGDWDRRNRLKVYEAVHAMMVRDFKTASTLLLDTKATFTSYEMFDYARVIQYTVVLAAKQLSRVDFKAKILDSAEVHSVIAKLPTVRVFMSALHDCAYDVFFTSLAALTEELATDRFLAPHCAYLCREMRIIGYTQALEAYLSVSLDSLADSFGVTRGFVEAELARFIASGRVNCKIDSVAGVVETTRPEPRNAHYHQAIRQSDALLNRVQKLARVINL